MRLAGVMMQLWAQDHWVMHHKESLVTVSGQFISQHEKSFLVALSTIDHQGFLGQIKIQGTCPDCMLGLSGVWRVKALKQISLRQGWYAKQYAHTHFSAQLVEEIQRKPPGLFQRIGSYVYSKKDHLPPHPNRPLLQALLWGDQHSLSPELFAQFKQTGTSHLLAISGLHVGMLMAAISRIVNQRLLALLLVWAYVGIALFPASAMRAALMLTLFTLTKQLSFGYLLCLTVCLHIIIHPLDMLSMGAALSYWAILNIRYLKKLQWLGWFSFPFGLSLLMMPITLWFFHMWPLHAVWINALVIPWMGCIVMPLAFINLVLTCLQLPTCWGWVYAAIDGMMLLLHYFHNGPNWTLLEMHWAWFMILHWAIMIMLYKRFHWRSVSWVCVIVVLLLHHSYIQVPRGAFAIVMLDVGQGLSLFIKTHHHSLIYDVGTAYAGRTVVVPFLRAQGIYALSHIIISHWDQDHVGGLNSLQSVTQKPILITPEAARGLPCRYGQSFTLDGVKFSFYHPTAQTHQARNKDGCVLMIDNQVHKAIFLADIGWVEEKQLRKRLIGQQVTLMVAAHHGSRHSNSQALLETLKPFLIWVSAGYHNPYKHPHQEAMARFRTITKHIKVTASDGQQIFKSWEAIPRSVL